MACFFSKSGHVATILLEDRKTVNSDWCINHCLPKVFEAWCKRRQRRPHRLTQALLLHHDNVSVHTAAVTLDFLAENSANLVTHPPSPPDLAPRDCFLFPLTKLRSGYGVYSSRTLKMLELTPRALF